MFWKRRPLIAGAVTLLASGLFIRLISTVYRIALVRIAGEDILGLYQLALPIYRLGWTLATAGLHVAINQLSADALGRGDMYGAARLRDVGLKMTLFTAFVVSVAIWAGSNFLAVEVLTDARTRLPLAFMSALLFPAALSAAYRGVLQGVQRMGPIAASTALEVALRSPVVLYAVAFAAPLGINWGASAIVFGLTVGEIASLALLVWMARSVLRQQEMGLEQRFGRGWSHFVLVDFIPYCRRLLRIGLPAMGSGVLNSILSIISVAIIPRRLGLAGLTMEEAVRAFGRLSGMAIPILYMPMVVISPIVQVLEPTVANRRAQRGSQAIGPIVRKAYFIAAAIGAFSGICFLVFPERLGNLLYGVTGLGILIKPLAIAAPFAYIGYVTTGTLYGLGRTGTVMINSAVGNLVRLWLVWTLAAQPEWGILGVMWGVVADYGVTSTLNLLSLPRALRRKPI